ncbi:MAG: DJ-1/PfpI family protein [Pseudomonadota bacterium]
MTLWRSMVAVVLLTATVAASSMELVKSYPEAGAVLPRTLRGVLLKFDQLPEGVAYEVVVLGDQAERGVLGLHAMGNNDLMAFVPGNLADGQYQLRWRVGDHSGLVPFSVARPDGAVDDVWEPPLDIGIVLYDGAEPLDVFGPLEMWMNMGPETLRVHLIAEQKRPVALTTTSYPKAIAPRLEAQYGFEDAPELDVLMVPGGIGTLVEVENPRMISFLQSKLDEVAVATSVCTGSALYAKAGVLEGVGATGNKAFFDYIVQQGSADWQKEARWVESGRFITSSGVSAGIDMSLAVLERFFGEPVARMIAQSTEYEWNNDAAADPFVGNLNSAVPYVEFLKRRFQADQTGAED